ncbi:MAG: hypothetical protein WBP59_01210 [Ilumatobacteraceae bacterium]
MKRRLVLALALTVAVLLSTWCATGCAERRPLVLGVSTATETLSILAVVLLVGGWWSGLALASAVSVSAVPLELIDASHSGSHRGAAAVAYFVVFVLCGWVERGESSPADRFSTRGVPAPVPNEVRRWERAGWLIAVAIVVLHIGLLVNDAMSAADERRDYEDARSVEGVIAAGGTTTHLRVAVLDPISNEEMMLIVPVWNTTSPGNGETVIIDVPAGAPTTARLRGDRFRWNSNLSGYPTPVALGTALAIGRSLQRRRLQRLQRTDDAVADVVVTSEPGRRRGGRSTLRVSAQTDSPPGTAGRRARVDMASTHRLRCPPRSPIVVLPSPARAVGRLEPFHAVRIEESPEAVWPTARLRARAAAWSALGERLRSARAELPRRISSGPVAHALGLAFAADLLGPDPDGVDADGHPGLLLVCERGIGRLDSVTGALVEIVEWTEIASTTDETPSPYAAMLNRAEGPQVDPIRALVIAVLAGELPAARLSDSAWKDRVVDRFSVLGPAWSRSRSPGWNRLGRVTGDALTRSGIGAFGRPWRVVDELPTGLVEEIHDELGGARSLLTRRLDRRDIAEEIARAVRADPWPYTAV